MFFFLLSVMQISIKEAQTIRFFPSVLFFFFSFLVTIFLFPGYCKAFVLKKKRKEGTPTLTKENAVYSGGVGHTVGGGNLE